MFVLEGCGRAYDHRSEGLYVRDMLSLGEWRMGQGCSGATLPPLSSPLMVPLRLAKFQLTVFTVSNSFSTTTHTLRPFEFERQLFEHKFSPIADARCARRFDLQESPSLN